MSLYIIPENQKLIWESIHKIPLYNSTWQNANPSRKEQQFNQIIRHFYETVQHKTLTVQEVSQLNRQTIMAILDDTKKMTYPSPPTIMDDSVVSVSSNLQNYNEREKEYSLMMKGNVSPQPIDFRISEMDEGPIENMDALITQHMKARDALQIQPTNLENMDSRILNDLVKTVQEMKDTIQQMQEEIHLLKKPASISEKTE